MNLEPDTRWSHKREGYIVRIADIGGGVGAKLKDANDAQWQEAVGYYRENELDAVLVRSKADFLAKFEPYRRDEGDPL
jgi:hypothetical protein